MPPIIFHPIGKVKNSITKIKREGWDSLVSEIVVDRRYEEALDGVEGYSHLWILSWLSRTPKSRRLIKKIHPRSRLDLPLVGVFATRSQYRPNPVGLTLVKLLERRGNVLKVRGLDALSGTPVLDIKPISPFHTPSKTRVPSWYHKLWEKPSSP